MSLLRCNVEVREVAGLGRRSQEQNKATGGETHSGTVGFETGGKLSVGGAPAGWGRRGPGRLGLPTTHRGPHARAGSALHRSN